VKAKNKGGNCCPRRSSGQTRGFFGDSKEGEKVMQLGFSNKLQTRGH